MSQAWLLFLSALFFASDCPKPTTPWSYSGATGPEHWAELSPDYAICGDGKTQSPVDLVKAGADAAAPIEFHYQVGDFEVEDHGYTIQANFSKAGSFSSGGKSYELLQIHFHASSEHLLEGRSFPMEMHMVHQEKSSGNLAVLGILFEQGTELNQALQQIWNHFPSEGHEGEPGKLDPSGLLPANRAFLAYPGSLTTPSCCQSVAWRVFLEPLAVIPAQLAFFIEKYPKSHRPIQPLNGRKFELGK